jgi:predicted methyltransferase
LGALACSTGPQPRDLSNADPMPLRSTSAHVANVHAVTELQDSPQSIAVLEEPDRAPRDRALDQGRQSADLLTYLDVTPGMRVAELGSGAGYFTELLARSVGTSGVVYGVNPPSLLSRGGFSDAWSARLAQPVNVRVVRIDAELGTPLPESVRGLDLIYLSYFYRDLPSIGVDRRTMLTSVIAALRSGVRFVVIDRATPEGKKRLDLNVMHVEEARNARYEIERAGLQFMGEGRFFRASTVSNDWNQAAADPPTSLQTQDRFVLSFRKL